MKKHQPDLYRARRIETYKVFSSNKKSICLADKNIRDNLNLPGKTQRSLRLDSLDKIAQFLKPVKPVGDTVEA